MALRWRQKVMLLKIESAYDTDATPTGAADAVLMENVEITPLAGGTIDRKTVRPWRGAEKKLLVNTHVALGFTVELAGAGAVDTAPAYGAALRACALSETITPTTGPVEYDPVSSGDESVTAHFHLDGSKHAITGLRGDVSEILFKKDQIPTVKFDMLGTYVGPVAAADPTPTFTPWKDPVAATTVNTPTFTLHGFAGILEELTLKLGLDVKRIARIGDERTEIDDRAASGAITIEAPALGTKDFFAIAKAETTGALQLIHGVGDGNIVQLDAPNVQLLNPRYGESEGTAMLLVDLNLVPGAAGDDEFKITTK